MKVYIDEKLKSYVVPSELRDSSKTISGNVFTSGTRIALGDQNFLRLFTAWAGKESDLNFDIDLSAGFIKETKGGYEFSAISYSGQHSNYASYSGDFTSCLKYDEGGKITAEFIDIDVKKAAKDFDYAIILSNIYSSHDSKNNFFEDINCFSGINIIKERTEKEQFIDINDSIFKVKLSGSANDQSHIPIVVDLRTNEIVIIDKYMSSRRGENIYSLISKTDTFKKMYFNTLDYKENMYSLINMFCYAKGYEITNFDDADIVISYDDFEKETFNISKNLDNILNILT